MKGIYLIIGFILILALILLLYKDWRPNNNSLQSSSPGKEIKTISPTKAREELKQDSGIVLLDVRTEEEYNQGHIPGSILLSLDVLPSKVETIIPEKNIKVFVYCRTGNRSTSAIKVMLKLGYEDVYNLGGIVSWPYEVE